jgi:hypothetical protein
MKCISYIKESNTGPTEKVSEHMDILIVLFYESEYLIQYSDKAKRGTIAFDSR